jgi:hypothetical protein
VKVHRHRTWAYTLNGEEVDQWFEAEGQFSETRPARWLAACCPLTRPGRTSYTGIRRRSEGPGIEASLILGLLVTACVCAPGFASAPPERTDGDSVCSRGNEEPRREAERLQ